MTPSAQFSLIQDALRQNQQVVISGGGNFEARPFGAKLDRNYIQDPFEVSTRINALINDHSNQLNRDSLEEYQLLISGQIQQIDARMSGIFSFLFFLFHWNHRTQLIRERRGLIQIQSTLLREINQNATSSPSPASPLHQRTAAATPSFIPPPPPPPPPPPSSSPPPPPSAPASIPPLQRSLTITQQFSKTDLPALAGWPEAPRLGPGRRSRAEIVQCRNYVQSMTDFVRPLREDFQTIEKATKQQADLEFQINLLTTRIRALESNIAKNEAQRQRFDQHFEGDYKMISHQVTFQDGRTNTFEMPMLTRQGRQQLLSVFPLSPKETDQGAASEEEEETAADSTDSSSSEEEEETAADSTDSSSMDLLDLAQIDTRDIHASISFHFGKTRPLLRESGPPTPMKPKKNNKPFTKLSLQDLVHVLNQDHIVRTFDQRLAKDRQHLIELNQSLDSARQQQSNLVENLSRRKQVLENQLSTSFDLLDSLITKGETYVAECKSRIDAWEQSNRLKSAPKAPQRQETQAYDDSQSQLLRPFDNLLQLLTEGNKSGNFCQSLLQSRHQVQCRQEIVEGKSELTDHLTII